jgi:hypothetical protein
MITEQDLYEYNKWLVEVWNPNQLHIPFAIDAPKAFLNQKNKVMSEEIEIQEVGQEAPKFDPNKKYTWAGDVSIVVSGAEFGAILNALRGVTSTQEAQALFLAAETADKVEGILARNVENGIIVEAPEVPKGSL